MSVIFPPSSGTRVAVPYDNYLAKLVFSVLFTVFICVLYHPPAATVLLHYNLIMHVLPVKTGVCVSVIYLGGTGGGGVPFHGYNQIRSPSLLLQAEFLGGSVLNP